MTEMSSAAEQTPGTDGTPVVPAPEAVATAMPAPPEPATAAPAAPSSPPGDPRQQPRSIELLQGVEMSVTVELGRTRLLMRDLLGLRAGSVVELDRPAGSPVDILVNGTLLARGEVVVVDDELGVRITEIAGGADLEA